MTSAEGVLEQGPLLSELQAPCYKMPLISASEQWHFLILCSAQPGQQSMAAKGSLKGLENLSLSLWPRSQQHLYFPPVNQTCSIEPLL